MANTPLETCFVDCTETACAPANTGIHRVVRNIIARKDLIGMDNGGGVHLLVIYNFSITQLFLKAGLRGNLLRRIKACPIATHQILPAKDGHGLQIFASLQDAKYLAKAELQRLGQDSV